jgi:O-acetyl-ADP-ribose deacetylase (regulator of RNase III)
MQAELDVQTRHQWLPEGSVLETSGPGGHRVYHAGFHALDGWMTDGAEDEVAYYAANIERCVEKILESVAAIEAEDRRRVAFPLIGTGSFRLPEAVSARLFFAAVAVRARASAPRMHVALVVRDQMTLESVVRAGTQERFLGHPGRVSGNRAVRIVDAVPGSSLSDSRTTSA